MFNIGVLEKYLGKPTHLILSALQWNLVTPRKPHDHACRLLLLFCVRVTDGRVKQDITIDRRETLHDLVHVSVVVVCAEGGLDSCLPFAVSKVEVGCSLNAHGV